jgi:phosphoserine phosphatase
MANDNTRMRIAVFDLNGTFYKKSSKDEFYRFLVAKKPKRLAYYVQMVYYNILLKLNQIKQTEFKENFFNYLDALSPKQVEQYAIEFWQQEYPHNFNMDIKKRLDELKQDGVQIFCASGGLELYVKPLFDLFYPIDGLVGTVVKYKDNTYKVVGEACKNEEKLNRLRKYFGGKPFQIVEAYSDSEEEILTSAEKAYLIKDDVIHPYKP